MTETLVNTNTNTHNPEVVVSAVPEIVASSTNIRPPPVVDDTTDRICRIIRAEVRNILPNELKEEIRAIIRAEIHSIVRATIQEINENNASARDARE